MPEDRLTPAMEDYLETILQLVRRDRVARSRDIAQELGVHKSTVTAALKNLGSQGLVYYAPYEAITLTPEGERAAKDVLRRHEGLRRFFIDVLGIEPVAAEKAACAMEHAAPREVVGRMARFSEFLDSCPRAGMEWLSRIRSRCDENRSACPGCVDECGGRLTTTRDQEREPSMTVALSEMKPGQGGKVTAVTGEAAVKRRVTEMGLIPGARVEVERVAPMGDPLDIRVKGYRLSLRRTEAAGVSVAVD